MDYQIRQQKLLNLMTENSIFCLFNKRPNEDAKKYDCNRNFFYLTGITEFDDILMLIKTPKATKAKLYIHMIDPEQERWTGKTIRANEASAISGISDIGLIESFYRDIHNYLTADTSIYLLEAEDDTKDYSYENYFQRKIAKEAKVSFLNGNNLLKSLRTIKSKEEAELIVKANQITDCGLKAILTNLKPGLKEYQIESYFDQAIKFNGATGYSFPTIAASGINSTCLHYSANTDTLVDGDVILFDLGASYQTYCADVSRTYPINGKFTDLQKKVYQIVLDGQKLIERTARPGYTTRDLNQILIQYYLPHLKKLGLIKKDEEIRKYYFHGVSHHLGMDCHDFCIYDKLKPGSIISNEPGLYIPEWKIGVRIEDDLYITEDGNINLSAGIIKEISDIEEYMAKRGN